MLGTSVIPKEQQLSGPAATMVAAPAAPARPLVRMGSALLLSMAMIEATQFGLVFVVAWLGGLGPATIQMGWKAAAQAALGSRGVTRLIRLAVQLTTLPVSLRLLHDASDHECASITRERLQQAAAILVTLLLTARTLDVWLAVDAAGRPTYTRSALAPGAKLCAFLGRMVPPLGAALAHLGESIVAGAFAVGDALTQAYARCLTAGSPIGLLVRTERECALAAHATWAKLQLGWGGVWTRALPVLLRAKALLIREEGVWF